MDIVVDDIYIDVILVLPISLYVNVEVWTWILI